MREYIDDIGRKVVIPLEVNKVVSLCPSITETIFEIGAGNLLAGRTDYCISPEPDIVDVPSVGKTLKASLDKIRRINPDLVIASKEENAKQNIDEIALEFPVYIFEITSFDNAVAMISKTGVLLNRIQMADSICNDINRSIQTGNQIGHGRSYLYFVWKNPWMVASNKTFIGDHLLHYKFKNHLKINEPYPQFSDKDLKSLEEPDIVFLPSEPYSFSVKDKMEVEKVFPNAKVLLVKGEMFCWYGSRMRHTAEYLKNLNL
jgi:iron complex transport system substrate-binding protein